MVNYLVAMVVWNIMVFLLYGYDKKQARRDKRRISEKTLFLSAFCMGGIGAAAGMIYFRHKTKHMSFKLFVPISILFNGFMIYGIYYQ